MISFFLTFLFSVFFPLVHLFTLRHRWALPLVPLLPFTNGLLPVVFFVDKSDYRRNFRLQGEQSENGLNYLNQFFYFSFN
jgi:hypothetical protein